MTQAARRKRSEDIGVCLFSEGLACLQAVSARPKDPCGLGVSSCAWLAQHLTRPVRGSPCLNGIAHMDPAWACVGNLSYCNLIGHGHFLPFLSLTAGNISPQTQLQFSSLPVCPYLPLTPR